MCETKHVVIKCFSINQNTNVYMELESKKKNQLICQIIFRMIIFPLQFSWNWR